MLTPLTNAEILEKLTPIFHEEFNNLQKSHLQPNEHIYLAAKCQSVYKNGGGFGYFLVTSLRLMQILFYEYYRQKSKVYDASNKDEKGEACDFSEPLKDRERESRRIEYISISTVTFVDREEYIVRSSGQRLTRLGFNCKGEGYLSVTMNVNNSQKAYDLVQTFIQEANSPSNPSVNQTDPLTKLLKSLAELHKEGLLTDEEFAAKKKELLSRY